MPNKTHYCGEKQGSLIRWCMLFSAVFRAKRMYKAIPYRDYEIRIFLKKIQPKKCNSWVQTAPKILNLITITDYRWQTNRKRKNVITKCRFVFRSPIRIEKWTTDYIFSKKVIRSPYKEWPKGESNFGTSRYERIRPLSVIFKLENKGQFSRIFRVFDTLSGFL